MLVSFDHLWAAQPVYTRFYLIVLFRFVIFPPKKGLCSLSTPLTVDAAFERHQSADELVDVRRRGESYQKEVHETIRHAM